jgi:hypothetical protein
MKPFQAPELGCTVRPKVSPPLYLLRPSRLYTRELTFDASRMHRLQCRLAHTWATDFSSSLRHQTRLRQWRFSWKHHPIAANSCGPVS